MFTTINYPYVLRKIGFEPTSSATSKQRVYHSTTFAPGALRAPPFPRGGDGPPGPSGGPKAGAKPPHPPTPRGAPPPPCGPRRGAAGGGEPPEGEGGAAGLRDPLLARSAPYQRCARRDHGSSRAVGV